MEQQLIFSLLNWSYHILEQNLQKNFSVIFKSLLCDMEPSFFSNNSYYKHNNYLTALGDYYRQVYNIDISEEDWNHLQDTQTIIRTFKLIFRIGLKVNQQKYVFKVLQLPTIDQKMLMNFISEINYEINKEDQQPFREEYKQQTRNKNKQQIHNLIEELEQKDSENRYLRQRNEDLQMKIRQFINHIEVLKQDKSKAIEELLFVKNQKHQLLNQMGITTLNTSVTEIIDRIRQRQIQYQKRIDQLQQGCEIKDSIIIQKNQMIQQIKSRYQHLKNTVSNKKIRSEKQIHQEYSSQIQQMKKCLEQMQIAFNQKLKQVQSMERIIKTKQKQIQQNAQDNEKFKIGYQKYKKLKRLYKNFNKSVKAQMDFEEMDI